MENYRLLGFVNLWIWEQSKSIPGMQAAAVKQGLFVPTWVAHM